LAGFEGCGNPPILRRDTMTTFINKKIEVEEGEVQDWERAGKGA
jgi:hypothetical protein